jgi:hypothetical protein
LSDVDAAVDSDESGWKEAGVITRRSEWEIKQRRLFGSVIEVKVLAVVGCESE